MRKIWKRYLACVLAGLLILPSTTLAVTSEDDSFLGELTEQVDDTAPAEAGSTERVGTLEADYTARTEQTVLQSMKLAAENDALAFYIWDEEKVTDAAPREDLYALRNKETGCLWWSSPINAAGDAAASTILKKELASALVLTYGMPDKRSTERVRSGDPDKCRITAAPIEQGVRVTYQFTRAGITVPVDYVLRDTYLELRIDCARIQETNSDKLVTALSVCNSFGAGAASETGSFLIPDGCGAQISFNNRKYDAKQYAQRVYGRDLTAVPATQQAATEQLYFPMYGILKEKNALAVIIDDGDGNATLHASVSGQSNTSYNLCGYQFQLRSTDTYTMGSAGDLLTVFEQGEIKTPQIALRYYPLAAQKQDADALTLADAYRAYLIGERQLAKRTKPDSMPLYVDVYAGVEKQKQLLGIPVTRKTSMTSFAQTQDMAARLGTLGVSELVLSLHNWTNAGISHKVDEAAQPAAVLGGRDAFETMTKALTAQGVAFYPVVNNLCFASGKGYSAFTDTAIRVSGSYARIVSYERAYGTPDKLKDTYSLLSPASFRALYQKVAENGRNAGLSGICIGDLTASLYGDYGKEAIVREQAMDLVTESLQTLTAQDASVLAQTANAYALPYASHVTDVPLSSSGFQLFDAEVPFYQMVLHGWIPYASEAINGSADPQQYLLQAIASGSCPGFDLLHAQAGDLKDTDFDVFFYAHADDWLETAAQAYQMAGDILRSVSDQAMTAYEKQGNKVTTTYADGTVIVVDFATGKVTKNGQVYDAAAYFTEGSLMCR